MKVYEISGLSYQADQIRVNNLNKTMERFWSHIQVSETGCWLWRGSKTTTGYGMFALVRGKRVAAHRLAFAIYGSETLSADLQVDHRCFNKSCVFPGHLRQVTGSVNCQHRKGPNKGSRTGVRGVHLTRSGRYAVRVGCRRRLVFGGTYGSLEEADTAAQQLRLQLFGPDVELVA